MSRQRLPVIVGFGGINGAGRASGHHALGRMVHTALSEQQAEELGGYIRESGMTMPQRHLVEEFLTEAQNEAWRDQDAAREREMSTTQIHTTGPVGEPVVMNAARTRSARNGQIPVYLWQDPMTLDEIEAEARKLSRGGLIGESSGPAPVIRRVEVGN